MPTTYDQIGRLYEEYANTATMKVVERHMVLQLVEELDGETVLDVACGHGYYTRLLKALGAGVVVGSDISPEMIRLAQQEEDREPLGIEYRLGDGGELTGLAPCDLVTAIWLLNYAGSEPRLKRFLRGIHARLKPGGRFVAITINPDFDLTLSNMNRYGIEVLRDERDADPPRLVARFLTDPPTAPITVDHWSKPVYEQAFREAGLSEMAWEPYRVSEELLREYGTPYWHDLLNNGLAIAIVARRG